MCHGWSLWCTVQSSQGHVPVNLARCSRRPRFQAAAHCAHVATQTTHAPPRACTPSLPAPSGGWRVVTLRGEPRLLVPLLVTGAKVWHLRPASVFYPKRQFEATLQLLPDGAQASGAA